MAISPEGTHGTRGMWDVSLYPAAEAGRFVGLGAGRVRRWLEGYNYQYLAQLRHQRPVIRRGNRPSTTYASFLDLVDLLFVKRFLDHGVSLQRARKALDEAARILGTDHFARQSFFTDGRSIYLQVKDEGDAILQLLSGGQWVIAEIILQLADHIEFDPSTELALRWYPMGAEHLVVLDPLVLFGRPGIAGRGVATANVYDLFVAERRSTRRVCSWMGLAQEEVEAAVEFEERLAA